MCERGKLRRAYRVRCHHCGDEVIDVDSRTKRDAEAALKAADWKRVNRLWHCKECTCRVA